jgi:hypothetical protein
MLQPLINALSGGLPSLSSQTWNSQITLPALSTLPMLTLPQQLITAPIVVTDDSHGVDTVSWNPMPNTNGGVCSLFDATQRNRMEQVALSYAQRGQLAQLAQMLLQGSLYSVCYAVACSAGTSPSPTLKALGAMISPSDLQSLCPINQPFGNTINNGAYGDPLSGIPTNGAFGSPLTGFPSNGAFGNPMNGAFGNPINGAFGNPINGAFGNPINGAFGNPMNGAFGSPMNGAFGNPINGAFGNPINGAFGNPMNGAFGNPLNNAFGNPLNNAFGNPMNGALGNPMNNAFGNPINGAFGNPMNGAGVNNNGGQFLGAQNALNQLPVSQTPFTGQNQAPAGSQTTSQILAQQNAPQVQGNGLNPFFF